MRSLEVYMRSLTVEVNVEDNTILPQESSYEEDLEYIRQGKCWLYQIPVHHRTLELCLVAVKRNLNNALWVPCDSLTPELIMHLHLNYIPLISWAPDEFLVKSLFKKNSLQSYEMELLNGKTIEQLLTHRLAWFREQGKKRLEKKS